ncbi:MAG: hypothetical protein WC465_03205 [Patescibacteria group bacterium]
MLPENKSKKISGYAMAVTGLIMLVINAVAYIFHFNFKAPALIVLGIVFAVIGMSHVRKSRK